MEVTPDMPSLVIFSVMSLMALFIAWFFFSVIVSAIINFFRGLP